MIHSMGKNILRKLARFCWILSLLMFITSSSSSAQILGGVIRIHGIEVSDPCAVKIFVSVFEARLHLLPGEEPIMGYTPLNLDAAAFEVYIDRKQIGNFGAKVFDTSPEGIDVVLAIDISESVYSKIDFVRIAVKAYIDKRRKGKDQIAILTFGSDVQYEKFTPESGKTSAFTDDIDQLKQTIEKDPSPDRRKKTVLFKAITQAIDLAAQGRLDGKGRKIQKAVIVLSDGHDEGTGFNIKDCISTANSKGIPIFSLAIPDETGKRFYHDILEKISRQTGGIFVPVNNLERLETIYKKLDELIKKEYVLDFKLPVRISDGKEHKCQIFVTYNEETIESDIVKFRPGLKPCPSIKMVTDEQSKKINALQKKLKWSDGEVKERLKDFFDTEKMAEIEETEAAQFIAKLKEELKDKSPGNGKLWLWGLITAGLILLGVIILVVATFIRLSSLKKRTRHQTGN